MLILGESLIRRERGTLLKAEAISILEYAEAAGSDAISQELDYKVITY